MVWLNYCESFKNKLDLLIFEIMIRIVCLAHPPDFGACLDKDFLVLVLVLVLVTAELGTGTVRPV